MSVNEHDQEAFKRAGFTGGLDITRTLIAKLREHATSSFVAGRDLDAALFRDAANFIERNIARPRGT